MQTPLEQTAWHEPMASTGGNIQHGLNIDDSACCCCWYLPHLQCWRNICSMAKYWRQKHPQTYGIQLAAPRISVLKCILSLVLHYPNRSQQQQQHPHTALCMLHTDSTDKAYEHHSPPSPQNPTRQLKSTPSCCCCSSHLNPQSINHPLPLAALLPSDVHYQGCGQHGISVLVSRGVVADMSRLLKRTAPINSSGSSSGCCASIR